jgi:HSP20 family protein
MTRPHDWTRDFLASPLNQIQDELQRVFGGLRSRAYVSPGSDAVKDEPVDWTPAVDLVESPDSITLYFDLPGVEASGVDVSISGTTLTIRGFKPPAVSTEERSRFSERASGRFVRHLELPSGVDADAVDARLNLGVLTVTLPKIPAARARTIPIRPT